VEQVLEEEEEEEEDQVYWPEKLRWMMTKERKEI